jgi:hypothetical protein
MRSRRRFELLHAKVLAIYDTSLVTQKSCDFSVSDARVIGQQRAGMVARDAITAALSTIHLGACPV